MNLDNVLPALDAFTDPERFGMARRRITVSTSGWTKGIDRLAREGGQCNLAVSLHGPDDETRAKLIPKRSRRPIREILDACDRHREASKRMTTFEYVLIKGINDSDDQAERLAEIARRHRAKINLIPYNETADGRFSRPGKERIGAFFDLLVASGARATLRVERGSEIAAACGQLRRRRLEKT
jgi:23S rRNA (adenine2503-C2)-methyltransferase